MAKKDDGTPQGRVAGYETGPDGVRFWRDPGNGQFAKPGWSTAKGLALNLVGLLEDLAKDRGDAGLMVHPKGDALKSLGAGPGDAVRARYLDSTHAMVEIVRDGKLIQRKVAWNTLDRPAVDTPDTPDVVETQAAEFAARLIAHSAGTDPAIDAELLDTVRTMFNHDLGDGYTSQVENATFAPGFSAFINLHGAINYNGVKVGTFSRTLFSKPGEDGTPGVEVDHGALAIHADHQGKGVGSRFFAASMTAYRANGIDRVATYAVSGAGTMNGAYTWAKAGFDWDLRGNERYKLATIGYRMLEADPESSIGKALSEWDGSTRDALPTPLEVALDPTGADVLKAKDASLSWSGIIQVRPTANVDVPTPVDVAPDPGDVPPVGTPFDGFAGRMATRVGFGDDALDDELIATAKQMFEHDLGDGHRSVVEVARFNAKGDLYISGQITNGRRNIGSFSRGITPAGIADANGYRGVEVGHGSLRLVPEAQGQGTGSRFFAASMDAYRAAGIDRVSVTASSDRSHNGAYTWAKAGFEWDQRPNQAYRARDIGELMLAVDPDSTIGRALRTWEDNQPLPEGFPSPLEVALDPTGAQVLKTGNVFWNGSIDLSDEAQAATAALADAASDAEAERVALYGPAIGQLGIADWETTKPWESNADDIASGRAPGWLVRLRNRTGDSAHATSVYRGNRPAIAVSEAYFDSPPASRRSTLYHEAGHTLDRLIGPVEQQLAYDTLLDGPNFAPSRDNPGEMIAEGYALLHTNPQWLADNQPNLLPWLIAQADRFGMPVPEAARNVEPQQFLFRNGDIVDDVLRIPEGVTFEDRSGAMFERTRTGARSMRNGQDVTAGYLSGVETSNGDPITNPARPQFTIRDDVPAPRPDTTPDNTPPLGLTGAALDAAVTESLDRTDPEYRDWATPEIMAQFADDVRSGAVVNVPHTVLPAILADGRVKSTHEINGDLTAERVDYEATFMGIPADTPNHLRPVYGTTAARIGDGSDYGDIVLFVNPDRKDVSFTGGDSLTFNAVPIFPDDVAGASPDRLMAAVGEEGGYLETQILGGLPLSDVTKIVVPGTTPDGSPIPDYRAMLDEAGFPGIAVETYKARYAPTGTMPIYGDFTTLTPLGATGDTPGAWKLTKESVTDEAGVQGTQAAEFAQRLVDTPSAAVTPTQIEFEGDSYSVYPDGRVTNADGTAASDYMAGVVREELRRRDTYGSDRYGPPPTTAQEARDAGYTEGPYWHATSPIAAEKILSDGFLAPGAEDWELDNDGTIEEWDKDGSTRPVYFGNTPEEVAGYGETAVPLMIRPGSKRPGTGFVEAFMVDPADAVPLTDVDAPFSAIPDAKKVARELNDRMESVVVGSSYPAIENLIDLADPVPGPLYKGSDNHTFDQMVADGTVTFKTPVSVSSELTGAEMFVDTEPRPLSNEEYLRWANGELPVRRDGYDTTTKPIMFEIMGAKAIDATATIESLYSTGDWDIRTDMFETSTTSTDLNEDLGWKAASQTSEWIAAAGDYRVVSVNEHDGYRYVRIEAVAAQPEPDAPTLPEGGELSPELAAVVALLDGTSTDFDNEDELVMDLGMALFTKDFGDGAYQAEFENGMISLHDESAKFDGIIYDNETFTNLGTFSRALSIDDETGVVEMYHDVFRINPDAQGKGIGSMFTAAQLDAYRQAGIDRVRTTAASGTSYDDDGVEYPGMRMNGAYTWAAAGFDWDPEVGYQDANNIGRKILRLDPESKLGAALVAWRGGEPDDTVPIPFDVAADPVGKRVLLGDMGGDQLEPMTWMAVLPLTERGGAAVRQPVTDAGRAKRDGVPLTAPETPAPAVPDVAAPDVAEPLSTVRDRIRQESLFAEDFGFTGTAAPTLFDPDAPPVERGPLVVGDLDGLGDALDRIEITANGDRFAANLDAEDVATVKRYAAQLFAHRGDYANSTVESVRPTALADGTPAFIVDGLITSESGFPIGSWQRQIAADRSVQPPVWAVRGTDLRMGEDNRGLGYGMWFVAESETALRDAGFDHVITDAVSDPARDLNGAYTMATAGYDWDTSPEGVDLVRTLGDALLGEDEDSWLGEALAGWDGTITEDFPTPLDIALDPDGFELLRHGQASWIGRRSLQDPNRTDLPPLDDPAWLGTRADTSVPELLSESAPFRAFSPGVQAALENVASQWYDHDLGDGYTSEVVGVSLARNSAGGLPVTVMGVIRDGDGNRIGEFTRALHRVNVDDLMEPVADGDDIVINHEYLSIGVAHQGKGLGSRFMAASLDAYQGHGIDVVTTNAMTDPLENLNGAYTWAVAGFDWDPASWSLAQEIGAHMLDADPDSVVGRMLVDDYNPDTSPTPLDVAMDPVGKLVLKGEPGVVSWNGVLPVNPGAARREPVTPAGRDRAGLTPPRPVPVSAADVGEFLAYTFANPDNPPTEAETRDAMALLYEHTLPNGYRTTVTEAKIRPGQFTGINVDGAIYESDGTLVGHFSRTIGESSDGLTARHESISLKEYHQGKGVGAQLTASVFDAYRDAGIAKVKTDAASTGTDAMNGAYTWAVAGFDWDPDDSKTLDKMHDIGNRMLRSDPDSALGQALVDTTGDNLADSPTPLDIALDPTGGNVLKGGAGNLVWPGVYYPSGDQREPITNPARERLGLDLIIPPTPAVPNTDDTADGTVPFDPNEPIPLTPRVGSRLMELGHSGYDNEEANAEATAIAKALFDHDLGDGYSTRIVTASSRSTVEQQGIVAADGEILGPDGTRVGTFSRQFRPMLFGTNGDGADRVPEVVWETPPQVSPIEGMELGETKSFAAADLPATLMPGAVISMTSASGSTLTGSVTDNGQIRFNDSPSLGMAWASTLGEFATEVPGRNRLRDAWSADGTVTITLPDSIPDEKRTVWNVTPDPDVGLGVVNDTLKIDLAHQGKGVGSRFVAASENGYAQIGVDQAIVHAVTRNYPTDPEDARYNGAYTWAKGGGYDFVAKGDFVDGVDMVRTLGRRMIQLDETSQMGALLSEWNGRDRDNIPTPLEVALDPTGAAALKDSEYSQWWGAKPLSDRFKAMQRAQREQSLTTPAEPPAPKITNDDTTVGGDVPFDLDQPIPLTSRVKARLAHLSEHGTEGRERDPEVLAIARAVFDQEDIGGGVAVKVRSAYSLNGTGDRFDISGDLVDQNGRRIGNFERRFRPMAAGHLTDKDHPMRWVDTPVAQVSPIEGMNLGDSKTISLDDVPQTLPAGVTLSWTKTGRPGLSPTLEYTATSNGYGNSWSVTATGPTGDVMDMPSMTPTDFRLDAARLSDNKTAELTLPAVLPSRRDHVVDTIELPNPGYGIQNYIVELVDEQQGKGIGSRFIAASEERYAQVGFDQTVVHAVGDGSRFNGAYTWAKAGSYDWMYDPSGFGRTLLEMDPNSEIGKRLAEYDGGDDWSGVPTPLEVALDPVGKELLLNGNVEWWGTKPLSDEFKALAAARRQPTPGTPDAPVAPTTAPEDLPINFGRWTVGEMVDADDINLLPEGTDFSAGFDSYTALGGDMFDNDGTTITGERLRRQLDGEQVYIDALPGNSGPPTPEPRFGDTYRDQADAYTPFIQIAYPGGSADDFSTSGLKAHIRSDNPDEVAAVLDRIGDVVGRHDLGVKAGTNRFFTLTENDATQNGKGVTIYFPRHLDEHAAVMELAAALDGYTPSVDGPPGSDKPLAGGEIPSFIGFRREFQHDSDVTDFDYYRQLYTNATEDEAAVSINDLGGSPDTATPEPVGGERRLPGWYLARMGNDITVEGANGTRATGQISTVSQDTRRGDTVTISTADGPRSFPVNTTIVVGSTGVEPWADGGMVARYRNRDYRIDSDGNVTKVDDYNASIAKSTATGVKNAAIADATERFTDAAPEPPPAPTPDPVPDVPNVPEPAPDVPEPVAPGTPEVPTLPTGGRDFAVARPEHVLNVGYSDGAIIEQLKQLPKGAGRQYTVTDAAGNRFRMVGKDERGLRYQMLAANDDTVVGEWIMLPAEAPFTISDVVPGTYDETFAGSDAAITRLGDEMLAKNPDLAPIVWSDISPAAWLDMSTEEQAQNGMPDAEQGQALRSAITRFLGEAQRAVVRVGDTSLSEREYLPYRFYKVESATVPTREYGAETTGAAKVLWTTEPPTPDAPAFKLTRAQLDSALDSDEPGRPDFVWTGQVRAPEWDAPVPDNPRTEEQRSAAVQKLATNIFPVDIPIWEADRLEEALPMGPKGMLIDALTRGGYGTPTDPAYQSLRVPVNGVVIRQDGSVQWSLSAPGEGDLSASRLYDGDVTYSIDDPLLPQAVAAATQRNQATQLSQILNGRQQRSGRGRTMGTPAGDYARWVDTQSKQIMDESFTDTTDLTYDQETGAFTPSATPTGYHVNSEQLRRAFADRDEQGNPRLWLNADDRAGVVGIETDYTKVRDKSLPFDDRVAALAEQRTALQRLLPGDGPQTWFSGPASSATITDVIDGTADDETQRNMQRVAMLQEFGMELHALVSEQFAASKVAAHGVDQADTDKAIAALSTGVFERELRSDVARGEHPVLGRLVAQMDGDPEMADDPFVLEDVKADSDDPTDGYTMTMRRLASGNSVQVKVGRAAIGGPLVTWIAKENQQARAEQIGPVTLHTDGHMADLAQFGDTLRSLNHVSKEADALAEVTAANRGGRRAAVTKAFPPEATRDAMSALLENTPVDRFAFYKFTHDASSGEYQIDGDAAHLSAVTAGTKDGRKNVKLTFVTMLGSPYYERKFTVTINDDNSMTLNKNGSRRAVGRAPANVDSNTYASMAAVVADLKKQAPKADKKDDKPTVDAATVAESTPLKAFHAVMEKMGVDMSTDESLKIGRGGEGPLKPIGEATAGLAETARAGLAVFPRAWTTVLAKDRPIRLQLRRGNVDFRSEGGYNARPGTRENPSGPHDLISTPDITLRPDYADVAGHEFGHSFQHVIPGLEKAEQWYLVSRVAASPPEQQKPRVYGTGRRGRTDYVFEDEFARSYTGRTYGSGVSEAREVFTTAVQGMYNDIGGQSGFGADTRLQAWAIAMMALHDPGVGTNTDRAAMTGAQLLGGSYSKKDVESLLKSSELTVAQRNELKDILASM